MTRPYLAFPSLNLTFKSGGYINTSLSGEEEDVVAPFHTLTINIITKDKEEVENTYPTVYPYSPNFELDN